MTLEEKIGQMLIIGFEHPYVDDHIHNMIKNYNIGGINLLGRNILNEAQTIKMTSELQALASTTLFLAVDQEGGAVVRFKFLDELTTQSRTRNTEHAYQIAGDRAEELRRLGINMNFSPVLDHVTDRDSYLYSRTFATTVVAVAELGNAMINGYENSGVIPVAKHFPGYGNVRPDPHKNAVTVDITADELKKFIYPFKSAIDVAEVEAIMTAHIIIPSIDSKSATISSKFLTDILREELGFDGVIITDDLEMVSAGNSVQKIAVDSIMAGADMVISTYTPQKHIVIFNAIRDDVMKGTLSEERIDQSVYRILKLKEKIR